MITNPVDWKVAEGDLPPGIHLTEGTLSGTPTQAGQFMFRVKATDAKGVTAQRDITLTVTNAKKAALLEQDYSVSGLIALENLGSAQACQGAGFALTSDEAAGTGTTQEYNLSSTTDMNACHAPPPTAAAAAGIPTGFVHDVSVTATAGVCTGSLGPAKLDACIDPGPNDAGFGNASDR